MSNLRKINNKTLWFWVLYQSFLSILLLLKDSSEKNRVSAENGKKIKEYKTNDNRALPINFPSVLLNGIYSFHSIFLSHFLSCRAFFRFFFAFPIRSVALELIIHSFIHSFKQTNKKLSFQWQCFDA